MKRPDIKPWTFVGYEVIVRVHLVPVIGQVRLSALTAQHVQRVISSCASAGLAGSTMSAVYGVLHQSLAAAERLGLVARDVSERVQRPRQHFYEMRPLSREEAQRFLTVARDHWLEPLFRLALTTGMRQGELLALKWRDVHLDDSRLSVVASMSWSDGVPVYASPKTGRSRRQIALAGEMVATLVAHRHQQRALRLRVGPAWQGEPYDAVFTDELGYPLHPKRVVHHFKTLLQTGGLPEVRFHDLRHTCATLLLTQGIHPKVVSEMLGHSSVSITLDRYSHVLPHMQEDAARAMATALGW
jgi:integrase